MRGVEGGRPPQTPPKTLTCRFGECPLTPEPSNGAALLTVTLALSLIAALCVLSAGISVFTLLYTMRRPEEPLASEVTRDVIALRTSLMDLADKVDHWMRRERVRKLRESVDARGEEASPPTTVSTKDELRRKLFGAT